LNFIQKYFKFILFLKMKSFFKEAVSTFKTTGTVKPSSKYLINDCLKHLDFKENQIILEFGAGNGCITQELLNRIPASSQLISFEVNPKFFNYCENNFKGYNNFKLVNHSAVNFEEILLKSNIEKVDYIISSLPLTLLKEDDVVSLLDKMPQYLKKNGCFVQYQYSLGKYRLLKQKFNEVAIDFTLRNVPPSFVYKCYI